MSLPHLIRSAVLSLSLLLGVGAWTAGAAAMLNVDDIATQIARSGSARVTVHLNLPFAPEGSLSAAAAAQQRAAIGAAQEAFIKEVVSGPGSKVLNRMAWMPAVVLEIDAPALERIRRSKRVQAIEADRLLQPAAPGALPAAPQ